MERFWSKVRKTKTCWVWQGAISVVGYGLFRYDGRLQGAHRVAWTLERGEIPVGLQIDHLCRNRACVRPSHMETVTAAINSQRRPRHYVAEVNAAKTHCPKGHEYAGANLYVNPKGFRICRACQRDSYARWAARQKNAV